ncbi:DNA polymerase III subunit gamma/tau, partial [Candidatus Bipolaricaulota bacterium]|nr:DNA polymerase III subunit gamma/tau [Candidatus Bipolaricaulota bacterium]
MSEQAYHISLYRRFRPQRFADVVGQEEVVRTLRNAVVAGEVAHAYLFSGERGIGKTSIARILARAVNCLSPEGGEPCNACENCTTILANRSLDILEIDGASNRGIDHIRRLREEVAFAPTDLRTKVYI